MKTFSATGPPLALDRRRAWVCVATNQLACPGLGTVMAGRRAVGSAQMAVMVAGFLLFLCPLLWVLYREIQILFQPVGDISDHLDYYRHYWWPLMLGIGLCIVAWSWSLCSGLALLRAVKMVPPLVRRVPPLIRNPQAHPKTPPLISA